MRRSCCRNPSNSAAPARSSERTFFSWRKRRGSRDERWLSPHPARDRGQDDLQRPLGAPSPSYHLTARPESSSWPPPPPCWSRSGGGWERRTDEGKPFQPFFFCCVHVENEINLQTCTVGTSSKAWMKSSSSTAPAPEPSLPTDSRHETCSMLLINILPLCYKEQN